VIYLDTSALIKLVRPEAESGPLAAWLNAQEGEQQVTSQLTEVELPRALRRSSPDRLGKVHEVLAKLDRLAIDEPVRATAAAFPQVYLRPLDAIHLATLDQLVQADKHVTALVTYDKRLAEVATDEGHTVAAPA
jgi:predicted nucleic acid-binding protein